jgi:hypothetical protein
MFAWIDPGEVLTVGTQSWCDWEFGAFMYLFHKDPLESSDQDCYFAIHPNCDFARAIGRR